MQTQFRPHRNHGAPRVVNTLTQEVLTEAAGLTLDHVGKRLQRALVGTGHRLTAAAVIEEAVDGFLQHALFIAHDDVRGLKFQEALQAVVTVDDAAVKVIQIRGRRSGGSTGSTSRIIHSGLMPERWKPSRTFRRLAIFLILASELVAESS